jgi:rhodanese-related sulfurtransferase
VVRRREVADELEAAEVGMRGSATLLINGVEWAHLAGAVNHPLEELDAGTGQLDRSRPVIVYCHDWY